MWNGIVLKTEAVFAGKKVLMEAIEMNVEADKAFFELPGVVAFPE